MQSKDPQSTARPHSTSQVFSGAVQINSRPAYWPFLADGQAVLREDGDVAVANAREGPVPREAHLVEARLLEETMRHPGVLAAGAT